MKRRQMRWILVCVSTLAGLGLMVAAPLTDAVSANASSVPNDSTALPAPAESGLGALPVPSVGTGSQKSPNVYSGYYVNIVGALQLKATITVPTVKCTNSATWGGATGIVAVVDSHRGGGIDEHGGGVEVGCAGVTGVPTYAAVLCDPAGIKKCGTLADLVVPGDAVEVTVTASGGCHPTCASVVVTVKDTTQNWTELSNEGTSDWSFDTFVAAFGSAPLADFGKVTLTNVTSNGAGFHAQRFNLVDAALHTLAKAGPLSNARTSFSVKWVRSS